MMGAFAALWCMSVAVGYGGEQAGFDAWRDHATYELNYSVDLSGMPEGDHRIRVWIPTPAVRAHQSVAQLRIEAPWPHRVTADSHGNRLVYLEPKPVEGAPSRVSIQATVERAPLHSTPVAATGSGDPDDPSRYLDACRRVPITGVVARLGQQACHGLHETNEKIRAIFDFVVATMTYAKRGVGWGKGDAIWACNAKYGNCSDFHSLIIGMLRSQRIPARFVIGFPPLSATRDAGSVHGYHCWAEVVDPGRGWIPVDASEAKKTGRPDDFFGVLPSDRVEFTIGRDLVLEPPQDGKAINFLIYPYAEVDGEPVDVPWSLEFRRVAPASAAP